MAVILHSASPRWRMARALESERIGEAGRQGGGIARGITSFNSETQALVSGVDNFDESLVANTSIYECPHFDPMQVTYHFLA